MINSKFNEKVKYIASLKEKKYREKHGLYFIEGIKLVDEIISSEGKSTEFIVLSKEILENAFGGKEILEKLEDYNNVIEVSKGVFNYLSDTDTPQGILVVMKIKKGDMQSFIGGLSLEQNKYIILDKISDSGNIGTIIRTAVSFGFNNIICTVGTTDIYSPKVVRSTMGAIEKINLWYFNEEEIKEVINLLKENNYKIVGTDLEANVNIQDYEVTNKTIYILGNESKGISETMKKQCDLYIKIPMENIQESLNVAVASGIIMYDSYIRGGN